MSLPPKEQRREPVPGAENHIDQKSVPGKGNDEAKKIISPTISEFFLDSAVSPSAFFKAIRSQNVKRFVREDEARALNLMETDDADGVRLWALISQSTLPDAVDTWIWRAVQDRLKATIGPNFDPEERETDRLLGALCNAFASHPKGTDKHQRKRAENWLRIGVRWLMVKRSLSPWTVAERLLPAVFPDNKRASQVSRRALQMGRSNEFKLAIAMASLGQGMVKAAQAERDTERQFTASLRHQLADAQSSIDELRLQLASSQTQLTEKTRALDASQAQLEAERQHWGHDLSETKAEQRMLLVQRVAPLLSDAIDALEIEPPAPHIALGRLKAVLSLIEGARS